VKITGFRNEVYLMRLDRPLGDANLPEGFDLLPGSILFIDTDEGITGVSLGFGGGSVATLFKAIEGEDPREVVGLWMRMNDLVHKAGNRGEACWALSAIDVALWDLKAKIAGEPLWRTLGAREGRVKAYASGIDYCLTDEELFAFYRRMAEQGIDGGKLKVGLDLQADLRRLGIMQDALSIASDRPMLMIDINEYWSPKQAVRYIRQHACGPIHTKEVLHEARMSRARPKIRTFTVRLAYGTIPLAVIARSTRTDTAKPTMPRGQALRRQSRRRC